MIRHARSLLLAMLLGVLLAPLAPPAPALAQSGANPSGLPLPRFVSVRSAPVNVRVGPGTRYDIAWIFVKPGVPVEIVQEFDTWRRIRDVEGAEGWVHQSLVAGSRTALVTPWASHEQTPLRRSAGAEAPVRAWLTPGLLVELRGCDGQFCEIRLQHPNESGRMITYQGFVEQRALWGVYAGEQF